MFPVAARCGWVRECCRRTNCRVWAQAGAALRPGGRTSRGHYWEAVVECGRPRGRQECSVAIAAPRGAARLTQADRQRGKTPTPRGLFYGAPFCLAPCPRLRNDFPCSAKCITGGVPASKILVID